MSAFHRARLGAVLLAGSALAPVFAHAEASPQVSSVIVTARPDPDDPPVVAAARRRLSETPGAVAAVPLEAYRDRFALGLTDALRDVPGAYVQAKFGEDARLSIRGSGLGNNNHNRGTLLAQDGVPLNEADGYGDFQLLDPLTARYVEVYKGGNALRFGGALLGGAVNYVTPTGRNADETGQLRLEGGSNGTARVHGELAGAWGADDAFAAVTLNQSDGWRQHSRASAARASLNLGHSFGEDREVRLILGATDLQQQIPGAVTLDAALHRPRDALAGNLSNNYQRNMRAARASVQTTWRLSPSTVLQGAVYATWKDLDHPIFQVLDQESRNFGGFARLDWTGALGGMAADAFVGGSLRHGDLDAAQWVNLAGSHGALTAKSRQNAEAAELFGEGRLFVLSQLALVAGGQYGRAERDVHGLVPAVYAVRETYDWFAPRVGVLWQAPDGVQAFANLTKSVEPPNFSALAPTAAGFTPLRPQEAWTAEIGTRGRRGPWLWDLALYRAELDQELLTFTVDPDHPAATFNAGKTVHQGLEAGLDWSLGQRWRLRQTYSWSDFRFDGDAQYGDNRLPVVPQHLYRAQLRYSHPAGWYVEPGLEWTPQGPWVDFRNTARAPDYLVWSLGAGWDVTPRVRAFVDLRNLTDERYVSNANGVVAANLDGSTAAYWPGEGRSAFGGLTWRY